MTTPIVLDDFPEFQRKVERLRRSADEAAGAYQELLRRVKEETGVTSLSEAERKLEEIKDEEIAAYRKYRKERIRFEEKWKGVLENEKEKMEKRKRV